MVSTQIVKTMDSFLRVEIESKWKEMQQSINILTELGERERVWVYVCPGENFSNNHTER